jgi:hypothetical protein
MGGVTNSLDIGNSVVIGDGRSYKYVDMMGNEYSSSNFGTLL